MRDTKVRKHIDVTNHKIRKFIIMANTSIAQLEHLSQQISNRLRNLDQLIADAWIEHELLRGSMREFSKTYYIFLSKEGITYTC